jgi:hypothetical protein
MALLKKLQIEIRVKHTYLIIIFIALQFMDCNAQNPQASNLIAEELEWRKEWINFFFREYRSYEENDLINCYEKDRSVSFDIERKVRAMNQFSFEATLSELRRYLASNSIEFDSLTMNNSHSWYNEREFHFAPVSFFLHTKGEIRLLIAFFDADQIPTIKEDKEDVAEFYKYVETLQNGCAYGYRTFTVFNSDLSSWKIKRIVINPDIE